MEEGGNAKVSWMDLCVYWKRREGGGVEEGGNTKVFTQGRGEGVGSHEGLKIPT